MSKFFYKKKILGDGENRNFFPNSYKLFSISKSHIFIKIILKIIKNGAIKNKYYDLDYPISHSNYVSIARTIHQNSKIFPLQNYRGRGSLFEESSYTSWIESSKEIKILSDFLRSKFKRIWRCRIHCLPSFGQLPWHIDADTSVACRVYMPISLNIDQDNLFEIERRNQITPLNMKIGEFWFINTGFKHRVLNKTRKDRFSLIFNTTSKEIKKWMPIK